MPRIGMETIRRRDLITATIQEVGTVGSLDVTVGQIAKRAGMSTGLAHHYFGGKEQILLAAMREILSSFRSHVLAELRQSTSDIERLEAIVKASFHVSNFGQGVTEAWLAFYAQAKKSPDAQRLLRVYAKRLHSNLVHSLNQLTDAAHAQQIALGLAALIDGFYIRHALLAQRPDRQQTIDLVIDYLHLQLGRKGRT